MNDTTTTDNGCALHNAALPMLTVPRDGIFDNIGAGRLPAMVRLPSNWHVIVFNGRSYGLWRTADRQVHLVEDIRENRAADWRDIEPSVVLIARQGQKIKVSQDYWVLDGSTGQARLVDC